MPPTSTLKLRKSFIGSLGGDLSADPNVLISNLAYDKGEPFDVIISSNVNSGDVKVSHERMQNLTGDEQQFVQALCDKIQANNWSPDPDPTDENLVIVAAKATLVWV